MISAKVQFNKSQSQSSFLVLQTRQPKEIPNIDTQMEELQLYRYKFLGPQY